MLYQGCLVSWKNGMAKVATTKCWNWELLNTKFNIHFFSMCNHFFSRFFFVDSKLENLNVANNAKCKAFEEK
jgi:hypothetical protein